MKYIILLSLLALAACAEPEPVQTGTRSSAEPDTASGLNIEVDTAWADTIFFDQNK